MLYDRHFTLITNHKPLNSIFGSKKGILVYTANRLQRWTSTLLWFFDKKLAKQMRCPDSSLPIKRHGRTQLSLLYLWNLKLYMDLFPRLEHYLSLQSLFKKLQPQTQYYRKSCIFTPPAGQIHALTRNFNHFFQRWSSLFEFFLLNALLFHSNSKTEFSNDFIMDIKELIGWYMYWPSMDKQLEELIKSFTKCQLVAKSPQKTILHS